ncbi:MAG: Ig-like domain-containing protein [Anaerolineae bacterium]
MFDDDENENVHNRFSGNPDETDDFETTLGSLNRNLEKILMGFIGLGLIVAAIIFFLLWRRGAAETAAIQAIAPTLIPTAAIAVIDEVPTQTPEPTLVPTPVPAGGKFLSPEENSRLSLNEQVIIEVFVSDPVGIRNIQIFDNGQTIFSQQFDGQTEVTYSQGWVPLSDGFHLLKVIMTNREGDQVEIAERNVRVIDFEFVEANRETLSRIEADVAAVRGLALKEPVDPHLMGQGELKQYMRSFDYTPADGYEDMLVLSQFDFLERGYDLYEASLEFAGSSIAGFYDPATKEFVIVSTDRQINVLEENTYAHELMHALQDQYFGLGELSTTGDVDLSSEEALALRALAEGEADLLESQYQDRFFTDDEAIEVFNIIQTLYRPTQFTIEPVPVLTAQFYFPYEQGAAFVADAYGRGGWDAVTNLWSNRPTSTEQILHPERYYAGDVPQEISINSADELLGENWRLIRDDVMGEFYIRQYLGQQLSPDDVNYGALGWGGDRYLVYLNDKNDTDPLNDETILIFKSGWDNAAEADHFGDAWSIYADAAYGGVIGDANVGASCRQASDLICSIRLGDEWLIIRAPSLELAGQIISAQ